MFVQGQLRRELQDHHDRDYQSGGGPHGRVALDLQVIVTVLV